MDRPEHARIKPPKAPPGPNGRGAFPGRAVLCAAANLCRGRFYIGPASGNANAPGGYGIRPYGQRQMPGPHGWPRPSGRPYGGMPPSRRARAAARLQLWNHQSGGCSCPSFAVAENNYRYRNEQFPDAPTVGPMSCGFCLEKVNLDGVNIMSLSISKKEKALYNKKRQVI